MSRTDRIEAMKKFSTVKERCEQMNRRSFLTKAGKTGLLTAFGVFSVDALVESVLHSVEQRGIAGKLAQDMAADSRARGLLSTAYAEECSI